jgi:hypothetical protein
LLKDFGIAELRYKLPLIPSPSPFGRRAGDEGKFSHSYLDSATSGFLIKRMFEPF